MSYTVSIPQCGWVNVDAPNELHAAARGVLMLIGESASGLGPYHCTVKRHGETWTVNVDVQITTECVRYQNSEETAP